MTMPKCVAEVVPRCLLGISQLAIIGLHSLRGVFPKAFVFASHRLDIMYPKNSWKGQRGFRHLAVVV